jgi:hypothetical protein
VLAVQAMWGLADLSNWLGNETGAARYRTLHASGVAAYNDLLWDEKRGAFGDWIDIAGRRRFYLYTWNNFNTINPHAGIANTTKASLIMAQVAAGYKTLQHNFSVPPEQTFCTPTNFLPADAADLAEDGKGGPQVPQARTNSVKLCCTCACVLKTVCPVWGLTTDTISCL